MWKNINRLDKLSWVFLLAGFLFLFVFSFTTSPLTYNSWGTDSVFFQYAGYSMANGQVMYRDIFDTKGPYFFFLQQIAYLVGGQQYGRYVLFLFQYTCMAASLILIDESCRLLHLEKKKYRLASVALFLILLSYTLDGGNLTEEYGLPLLFLCQYLMLRTITRQTDIFQLSNGKYPLGYTFCYGFCFGILAFIRITNSCLICCIVLYFLIVMLVRKQWMQLLKNMAMFMFGIVTALSPMLLWYAFQGSLKDMIYATFVFAFTYATEGNGHLRLDMYAPMFLLCISAILLNVRHESKHGVKSLINPDIKYVLYLMICLVVHTGVLLLGFGWVHYYQLVIPPTLCAFWCIIKKWYTRKIFAIYFIIAAINISTLYMHIGRFVIAVGTNTEYIYASPIGTIAKWGLTTFDSGRVCYGYQTKQYAKEILQLIPDNKRDSIYSDSPTWLFLTGRLSNCKYLETPGSFMKMNDQIHQEITTWFSTGKWEYIVLEKKDDYYIREIVAKYYGFIGENDKFSLYQTMYP